MPPFSGRVRTGHIHMCKFVSLTNSEKGHVTLSFILLNLTDETLSMSVYINKILLGRVDIHTGVM